MNSLQCYIRYRLERKLLSKCDNGSLELLVSSAISRSFRVMLAEADGVLDLGTGNSHVLINTEVNAELFYDETDSVGFGLLELHSHHMRMSTFI